MPGTLPTGKLPLEEILDQLARDHGTTREVVREEMEAYLEEVLSQEGPAGEQERHIAASLPGGNLDLAEFIARLAQEMELEKGKEEDLRAYFEG